MNWWQRFVRSMRGGKSSRRVYESARAGRDTAGWQATNTSANAEIGMALPTLRARSRDLVRNNAHAASCIQTLVGNLVGDGAVPQCATDVPELDRAVDMLWRLWSRQCAADGSGLTLQALETLVARSMFESGEVLVRRIPCRLDAGLVVPLQLQVLEADFLDSTRVEMRQDGHQVVQGVELDGQDRIVGYWLLREHPGDLYYRSALTGGPGYYNSVFVPIEDVAHVFESQRPGQRRGVPRLSSVLVDIRDLDDYDYAERLRKKAESCVVGVVEGGDPDEDSIGEYVLGTDGQPVERMQPGSYAYAPVGRSIKFNAPAATGGYAEYMKRQEHVIAAGAGVPYELMTGDLEAVNYTSIRTGLIEFRRSIRVTRAQCYEPLFLDRIWRWFIDACVLAGYIPDRVYPVRWSPVRFEDVDRLVEAQADLAELRAGTRTLTDIIGSKGRSLEAVLQERAAELKLIDEYGLILDSDPRFALNAGRGQQPGGNVAPGLQQPDTAKQLPADGGGVEAVQDTALSGIQIAALGAIIDKLIAGQLDAATAKLQIGISFPSIPADKVAEMVDSAAAFTPAAPAPADDAQTA